MNGWAQGLMGETGSHARVRTRLAALAFLAVCVFGFVGLASEPAQEKGPSDKYHFYGTISREVLENYLDRSVTMAYFLVTGKPEGNREYLYRDDDVRLIRNIGAKFIGRAIYRWNGESRLNDPNFWRDAKALIEKVHAFDPDVIFQGCLFETISTDVNRVKIPAWVFTDFGLPVEDRTFSYEAMLNQDGKLVNHWGRASVPDVTRPETQLWFYYLAGSYIDLGCEALHLGQVGLIGMADRDWKEWLRLVAKIRTYAKTHARRKLVLLDAHVPTGGMVVDGVSLLDFNSFPMRIKAIPEKPHEAELQVGHLDGLYKRSKGCISPSGWTCQSLPYLVEFDNFGRSRTPNVADAKSIFVWGWDEISWFSLQPEEYRNKFLVYAYHWLKETDSNGHLQMPVSRMISCPNETLGSYRANTKSPACPIGYSQEETIKQIWSNDAGKADATIRRLIGDVNSERMSKHLFYLAKDPLPYRKLNLTLPGHEKNTLYEADDYLASKLEAAGYRVEREGVQVQAFRRDTSKPKNAQYSPPKPEDPWYTAYNLYAEKKGRSHPEKIILVCAHKDSQSWIDSPGANDNAIGTVGVLEMACVLAKYDSECTIRFLWCNEEHTPWTSKTAAQNAKSRGDDIVAVFNTDGIGVKPAEQAAAGKKTNVTAYTKPEGKKLAELMSEVNARYAIGLEQRIVERSRPGDDDGSFVLAGYGAAIINIGSWPYGDPEYHAEGDIPERCDLKNAAMTVQATLGAVVTLDQGR